MGHFDDCYTMWLDGAIRREMDNPRRRELLEKGLGHGYGGVFAAGLVSGGRAL